MPKAQYMELAKFQKLQESLNAIDHNLTVASIPMVTTDRRQEAIDAALRGLRDLNSHLMETLRDFDRRLYALEP